jgi:hypothetical protein
MGKTPYIFFNMALHNYWDINHFKLMSTTDRNIFFNVCKFKMGHCLRFEWRLPVLQQADWQTTVGLRIGYTPDTVPQHKHYFPN